LTIAKVRRFAVLPAMNLEEDRHVRRMIFRYTGDLAGKNDAA
jgi:hypothetical protein